MKYRLTLLFLVSLMVYTCSGGTDSKLTLQKRDWPSYKPEFPPVNNTFSDFTPDELIPYVLGEKTISPDSQNYFSRNEQRLACAWFIWKTTGDPEIREVLADKLLIKLLCVKSRHDNSQFADFLGCLEMPDHIKFLLEDAPCIDCCYGPLLVEALTKYNLIQYAPALFDSIECDTQGVVVPALIKLTGREIDPKSILSLDPKKQKENWVMWWQSKYSDLDSLAPTEKYLQLSADERIQAIRKVRRLLWVLRQNFKPSELTEEFQRQYPDFPVFLPKSLDELIGMQFSDGTEVTSEDIESINWRLPDYTKELFNCDTQPLMRLSRIVYTRPESSQIARQQPAQYSDTAFPFEYYDLAAYYDGRIELKRSRNNFRLARDNEEFFQHP